MTRDTKLIGTITQLLQQEQVHNHQELCTALEEQGFSVTQSTVSRLLRKVGAMKGVNAKQESVYLLPKEPLISLAATTDVNKLVISITHNEQMIVIHTTPGSANMIARLLDLNLLHSHVLGTIAGDDTIIVVPISMMRLDECLKTVANFLGKE